MPEKNKNGEESNAKMKEDTPLCPLIEKKEKICDLRCRLRH